MSETQATDLNLPKWRLWIEKLIPGLRRQRETYRWGPLPQEEPYIRYLKLQPGTGQEPFVCSLHTTPLANCPKDLEAISYVWGSNKNVAELICDGRTIGIRANLRDVLQRVRSPDQERKLWIDAICINQDNRNEKSHQVKEMGKIYKQVERTLICVGEDNGQGEKLASFLKNVIDKKVRDGWEHTEELTDNDPIVNHPGWVHYGNFIARPWFSRVWVVQEAGLSSEAIVIYGKAEIPWKDIIRFHRWLVRKAAIVLAGHQLYLNRIHINGFYTNLEQPRHHLISNLVQAKTLNCTNGSDRIYAFLGSPNAQIGLGNSRIVTPDYNKSHLEVYLDFARTWLEVTNDLCLLSAVEHSVEALECKELPSWVPRWDIVTIYDQFGLHDKSNRFDASRGTSYYGRMGRPVDTLRVRGLIVDSVQFRSNILCWSAPQFVTSLWCSLALPTKKWLYSIWTRLLGLIQDILAHFPGTGSMLSEDPLPTLWGSLQGYNISPEYRGGDRLLAFIKTLCTGSLDTDFSPDEAALGLRLCTTSGYKDGVDMEHLRGQAVGGDESIDRSGLHGRHYSRRFFITKRGFYGLGPQITAVDDVCCIVHGLRVPLILRKTGTERHYKVVGEAYILGIMQGEALENQRKWGLKEEDIILC